MSPPPEVIPGLKADGSRLWDLTIHDLSTREKDVMLRELGKHWHLTRRAVWVTVFLALTAGALGMELWAGLVRPGPDDPAWTDLIVRYVPAGVTFALISALVAWIGPHFVAAYRNRQGR